MPGVILRQLTDEERQARRKALAEMNEKRRSERRSELLSLIEQLQSPIDADKVAYVTGMAAKKIQDLWKQLEACEAHVEHLKQLQTKQDR
jgi:DNA polymerase/3'-5' exonuclease PolX